MNESTPVKIYALADPRTKEIKYIGKTNRTLEARLSQHLSQSIQEKNYRANWIKSLIKQNLKPETILLEECSEENWAEREKFWISYGREQNWRLTNSTEGGEGCSNPSDKTRKKLSESMKGKQHSLGYKFSEESRRKMSESRRGKNRSPETIRKMSEASKGNKHALGHKHSKEIRRKISESMKGKQNRLGYKHSEESRRKMSESRRGKNSSLSELDIREIRRLLNYGIKGSEIGAQFGITSSAVSDIKLRKTWSWVE